jgi:chromosome segregation ATPase
MEQSALAPLHGLEKISAELLLERQKSTAALKERARQKIEIERLRQENEEFSSRISDLTEKLSKIGRQGEADAAAVAQHSQLVLSKDKEIHGIRTELERSRSEYIDLKKEYDSLKVSHADILSNSLSMRQHYDDELQQSIYQERAMQDLQDALLKLKNMRTETDLTISSLNSKLAEKSKEVEEYRLKARRSDAISEKYSWLQQNGDEVRNQLEETLRKNTALIHQVADLTERLETKEELVKSARESLDRANAEINALHDDISVLETTEREYGLQIDAFKNAIAIEKQKSESSQRSKEYLEAQVNELREAHSTALQQCAAVESELAAARTAVGSLNAELMAARDQNIQQEALRREAESARSLSTEVERLHAELLEVRRQLVRRDLESEAAAALGEQRGADHYGDDAPDHRPPATARALAERESHSRQASGGTPANE